MTFHSIMNSSEEELPFEAAAAVIPHTPCMNSNSLYAHATGHPDVDATMSAHMRMKQALMDQADDVPYFVPNSRRDSSAARSDISVGSAHSVMSCASYRSVDPRGPRRGRKNWAAKSQPTLPPPTDQSPFPTILRRGSWNNWADKPPTGTVDASPNPFARSSTSEPESMSPDLFFTDRDNASPSPPLPGLGMARPLSGLSRPTATIDINLSPFITASPRPSQESEPPSCSPLGSFSGSRVPDLPVHVSPLCAPFEGDAPTDPEKARPVPHQHTDTSRGPSTSTASEELKKSPDDTGTLRKRPLFCTWTDCRATFRYRYEWARHEEAKHYFPYHWVCCLEGPSSRTRTVEDCNLCGKRFASLQHIIEHMQFQSCTSKEHGLRTFLRKDHLIQHIKGTHSKPQEVSSALVKELVSAWRVVNPSLDKSALCCGFCGKRFTGWKERQDHVYGHLRSGQNNGIEYKLAWALD
jgi:hypothetical protein